MAKPEQSEIDVETGLALTSDALRFRLFNDTGALDLAAKSVLFTGLTLNSLEGRRVVIPGTAYTSWSKRNRSGKLRVTESDETDVDWDAVTVSTDARGQPLWVVSERQCTISQDRLVLAPEGFADDDVEDFYDEDRLQSYGIGNRAVLLDAVKRYLDEHGLVQDAHAELMGADYEVRARDVGASALSAIGKAQTAVGFAMHLGELHALRDSLARADVEVSASAAATTRGE